MCHPQQVVAAGPARLQGGGVEQGSHMIQRVAEASIRLSANQCTSRIRRIQPQDHAHRGRLSRAIGSHEAGYMTGRDGEGQPVEGHCLAEPLAQAGDFDGCIHATEATRQWHPRRHPEERSLEWLARGTPRRPIPRARDGGSLTRGTPRSKPARTMVCMGLAGDLYARWSDRAGRIAMPPHASFIGRALLGLLAVAEAIAKAQGAPQAADVGGIALYSLILGLVALATVLPVLVFWAQSAAAGVAVTAASLLSLTTFQTLTVAGAAAQIIAGYRLGRHGSPLLAVLLAAPYLLLALTGFASSQEAHVLTVLLASLAPAAALAGIAQRARLEANENRAARQVIIGTLLEHTARGERARIARELHDVVAHHISMVVVQAETARLAIPEMPAAGAQRLSAIGDTARAALTEMRRLLGVLREDTQVDIAERQPQPGLRELNDLVDTARDTSGTATRFILHGTPTPLDPGVELAAYRIVQEALTNARRHAPGAAVDVELHYADEGLRVRIRDNGPGPPAAPPIGGQGLLGMRERAVAVGGELQADAAAGGGFVVTARLPGKAEDAG